MEALKELLKKGALIMIAVILTVALIGGIFGAFIASSKNASSSDGENILDSKGILFDFIASWENESMLHYIRGDEHAESYNSNVFINQYVTEDKKNYICNTDYGLNNGTRNFGFGVMHYQNGKWNNVEFYKQEGIDIQQDKYTQIGTLLEVDIVDRVKSRIIDSHIEIAKNKTQGLDLKEYQIHALVDTTYQAGPYSGFLESFVSAYKKYGNTEELRNCVSTYWSGNDRGNARWKLFHEGVYTTRSGLTLNPNDYSTPSSRGDKNNPYYGVKLYNSDGSVNKESIKSLEKLETDFVNAGDGYRNGLQRLQCTWWANGRASQYLAQCGTKYDKYPTTTGNGGDYWQNNINGGWFKYGTTPKPNSILCYAASPTMGGRGHVTYVEAVDTVNKKVYISHASSGVRWNGIDELDWDGTLWGAKPQGYIYLDEPL